MTDKVFIEPLDLSAFGGPTPTDSPGFTQLVQDVLGTGASEMDGFDAALADAAALVEALDKITGEQDAALDAILVTLDTSKPDALDNSMAGYVGTADAGAAIVAQGVDLGPPNLLELPISPSSGGFPAAPPILIDHDFGDVKLGSAAVSYDLGWAVWYVTLPNIGLVDVQLINFDKPGWEITTKEHELLNGDTHIQYFLQFTPTVLGKTTAQVNTALANETQFTIYTFTANVVP